MKLRTFAERCVAPSDAHPGPACVSERGPICAAARSSRLGVGYEQFTD